MTNAQKSKIDEIHTKTKEAFEKVWKLLEESADDLKQKQQPHA